MTQQQIARFSCALGGPQEMTAGVAPLSPVAVPTSPR
jgi:hypothetical protein